MRKKIDELIFLFIQRNSLRINEILNEPLQKKVLSDEDKVFRKELMVNDFQQCMYMVRHYDSVNWDLTKFAFGQIMIVLGACWTIMVHEKEKTETLLQVFDDGITHYILGVILLFSALFDYLSLAAILRNRSYFVKTSKYLNEYRRLALKDNPYGFQNECKMWTNPTFPKLMDWKSTQILCVYLLGIFFLILLFSSLYCLFYSSGSCLCWIILGLLLLTVPGFCLLKKVAR